MTTPRGRAAAEPPRPPRLPQRRAELVAGLRASLLDGRSGVLVASRGAGASTVLAAVVSEVDAQGRVVHVIAGADAVAEVPLAPFGPVAQTYGVHDGEALRLYTSLGPRVVEADAVVVVDDADRLDPASAVLVTQLLRAGVPCLLGCRDDGALGRPLREQLARASASVVTLDLLDSDEMLELAAHQLGDQLSPPSSATLLAHARGVPVVATELLRATPVTGSPSGLVLGDLVITDPVRALVAEVLVGLDAAALDVLDLLAVAGALPRHRLPAPAVELLEARGLVTWVEGDSIELADPLVDDVLTDAMGPLARRRVSARAADLVDGVPGWEGLAVVLTVDAGRPVSPADAARSARRALAIGRSAEARTVLAAVEGDHDAEHHLLLGAALAADGEVERAGHHLDRAEQLAADDDVRVQVGQELGLLHAVRRADPAVGVERVARLAAAVRDPDRRRILDADLVKWRLMAGLPAGEESPVPAATDAAARVNDALIHAMVETMGGDLDQAMDWVRTGLTAVGDAPAAPAYAGDLLWLSRYLATAFAGRVHEAEAIALTHRDHAARVADPALGMWEFAAAELALHAGRLEHAQALAARAERHLAWRDFTGLGPAATALRAAVEARLGRRTAATELLLGVTDDHRADVKVDLHVSRVRAEEELRAGRRRSARDLLATSGTLALEQGHAYLGLLMLDEAFMVLPSPDLAAVLDGESGRSDLVAALAVRACAVAEGDADLTARSASMLREVGMTGRAAQALAVAADLKDRRGSSLSAREWRREAVLVLARARAARWPGTDVEGLTPRELDVARLAARRVRSREIAATLDLSVRTVDNHLARIFRKLGVSGRDELVDALADEDGA